MTTVREIAAELGVSKTAVMKFCKEELHLKPEPRKTLQLSANQCSAIADRFATHIQGKQCDTENNHLQEDLQFSAHEYFSLQTENAELRARIDGLERENELLRERLQVADEVLKREQLQKRGFWNRLGQKLLGDGARK